MIKQLATREIVLTVMLASFFICSRIAVAQSNSFSTPLKAGKVEGMKVEDSDGQKAGIVRNLVIDTQTGQLKYVVIASGGFLGLHSTLRLAPSQILSTATTKRETLAINVTTAHWQHAPAFKSSDLASLGEPNRIQEISRYFGISEARGPGTSKNPLPATGHGAETLRFASDLIGRRVINRKQEKIGEVQDLLISFGPPHQVFAIVSGGRSSQRELEYAVPLSALRSTDSSGKLLLDTDGDVLEHAPPFNQQAWQTADARKPRIYSYLKTAE